MSELEERLKRLEEKVSMSDLEERLKRLEMAVANSRINTLENQ